VTSYHLPKKRDGLKNIPKISLSWEALFSRSLTPMLFIGGVVSIFYRVEFFCVSLILYILLPSVVYVYCLPSDWVVFVNTWQKGGEKDEIWRVFNCLYLGGENKIFWCRGRWWNCFWKWEKIKFFDVSNLGGELVCIFVIFCLFVLISTHALMCSSECFRKERYILIKIFCLF